MSVADKIISSSVFKNLIYSIYLLIVSVYGNCNYKHITGYYSLLSLLSISAFLKINFYSSLNSSHFNFGLTVVNFNMQFMVISYVDKLIYLYIQFFFPTTKDKYFGTFSSLRRLSKKLFQKV